MSEQTTMQPVRRAFRILRALSGAGAGRSLGELAEEVAMPVSSVHRLLAVLEDEGFAVRTDELRYFLGPAARNLVSKTSTSLVRHVAAPALRSLARSVGETAFLAELIGGDVICIDYVEGTRALRHHVQVGSRLPLHAASSARAILAHLPPDEAAQLVETIEFTAYTDRTITAPAELRRHLAQTRADGFDVCDDEMEHHVWAVSAPLRDSHGAIPFAITAVAPLATMHDVERRRHLIEATVHASASVSAGFAAASDAAPPAH